MWKNGLMCLTNGFEIKVLFKFLRIMCFYFFAIFFKLISCTKTAILPKIGDHIFKTVFLHHFLFSLQSLKMSKNMRKLHVKLRYATIYPPWGKIFKKYFFQKHTPPYEPTILCILGTKQQIFLLLFSKVTQYRGWKLYGFKTYMDALAFNVF